MSTHGTTYTPFDDFGDAAAQGAAPQGGAPQGAATQPLPLTRAATRPLGAAGRAPSPLVSRKVAGLHNAGPGAANAPAAYDPPAAYSPPVTSTPPAANSPVGGAMTFDDPSAASGRRPWYLPISAIIGLGMVGGAVIVLLMVSLVNHVLPHQEVAYSPNSSLGAPPLAQAPVVGMPAAPTASPLPAALVAPTAGPAMAPVVAPPATTGTSPVDTSPGEPASTGRTAPDTIGAVPDSSDARHSGDARPAPVQPPSSAAQGGSGQGGDNVGMAGSGVAPARSRPRNTYPRSGGYAGAGVAPVTPRGTGYTITPPPGFTLQQTGRRTVWRGPSGARVLVETAPKAGGSPRADWERLDAALGKKYGGRYHSHGISETTLAGRPAAVWEFEVASGRGATRKIDVAVHDRGTGYAVLVSAPAARFDELRPQLEAAIRSFQLSPVQDVPADSATGAASSSRPYRRSWTRLRRYRSAPREGRGYDPGRASPDGERLDNRSRGRDHREEDAAGTGNGY